ncbi:MAG: SseB family protein [Lachnospiraceae bacterium]|nr:SseB family protein [Lachnospiraceae bacterium]
MTNNSVLETLTEEFVKDRSKENFVKIMEQLEKAVVFVPTMMPENLDEESKKQVAEGKAIKLPKESKIMPCLLRKENGEQAMPIFSSQKHISTEQKSPAVLAMPFFTCVAMVMANTEKVQAIVLNPFTQNIVIPKEILEVAQKRSKMPQTKTVKVTEKQFHALAHRQLSYDLLPKFLYENKQEGLERLQREEGKLMLELCSSIYPKEIKVPYTEDDFSFLTLNITESMQITRIDMPEKNLVKGSSRRIYAIWKRDTESVDYYTIEKADEGNDIGRVSAEKKHEIIEHAPDNGAEIETIMNLASGMEQ